MIGSTRGRVGRPQKLTSEVVRIPCPYDGIDDRISLVTGDETHCIYTFNLVPNEQGMKLRKGYREWQLGVEQSEGVSTGVHTLIPFDAVEQDGLSDKLFAVNNEGIWEVTIYDDTPVLKLEFGDKSGDAGWGNYVHYTNLGGDDVMFYADSVNGLFSYDPDTNTWSQAAGITGLDITKVNFITVHKSRIWLVEQNSNKAYYLPPDALAGAVTAFNFGSKFLNGGNVAGLFSWTIDGGAGVDDFLVAVSRAGDVLVYQGNDPASVDSWSLQGSYFIGKVPRGASFGSIQGADLYLLSIYGLNSMGELLRGVDSAQMFNSRDTTSPSAKISSIIQQRLSQTIDEYGWSVKVIPTEGGLLVDSPTISPQVDIQYFYKTTTASWGLWRGVPMLCFDTYGDSVYIGTADSRVMVMDVNVDNALIDPPEGEFNGMAIPFSTLTSYRGLGRPALYKRGKFIRPDFVGSTYPDISVAARYDYDLREALLIPDPVPSANQQSKWDVGIWDQAVWGGSGLGWSEVEGAWGLGRYVAIAMVGEAREELLFVGWDFTFDSGGPMV